MAAKKKQVREVIAGEERIAKSARISVRYLRRIWRHGGGGPYLVERLGRITGYPENLFIYGNKRAMGRLAEEAKQQSATTAPTARATTKKEPTRLQPSGSFERTI